MCPVKEKALLFKAGFKAPSKLSNGVCYSVMLFLSFSASCSHFTPKAVETPSFRKWVSSGDAPKIIAILPFTNATGLEDLGQLVRESFYKHFSVRDFLRLK